MKNTKVKLQTVKPWRKRDYLKTIGITLLNYVIIIGIFVLSVFLNTVGIKPSSTSFIEYFTSSDMRFIYLSLIILLLCFSLFIYFFYEQRDFFKKISNAQLVFCIIEVTLLISIALGRFVHVYARPLVLAALLTMILIDRKSALFVNTLVCLMMFLLDTFTNAIFYSGSYVLVNAQYSALIMGFTTGVTGIYFISGVKSRMRVILRSFTLLVPELICVVMLSDIGALATDWRLFTYGLSSGFVAIILYLALLPPFESIFNKTTEYRLSELTDTDSPLIKRMIDTAPGTFNHSIVVANLSVACATAIGEDSALARACAYYHDIGKLKEPRFFAENQIGGENLHNELTPEISTNIIRAHAKDGYDLAKKFHLPEEIADVCIQHHGTMPIKFFYAKALKFTDGDVDIEKFSYQGPKPQTKIAAIIMIADSAEAISRTLTVRDRDAVDKAVQSVIDERLQLGQFDECPITMRDLYIIKNTIDNSLTGVYHSRIKYPKVVLDVESIRSAADKQNSNDL